MRLIPIAVFPNLPQAHHARVVLDEAEIDSEIGGEGMGSVDPFAPLRRGNVQLLVPEGEADRARTLLQSAGYRPAVARAEKPDQGPRTPTWPRPFRVAGILIIALSLLLLIMRGDPTSYWLIGIGAVLLLAGLLGARRQRGA